MSEPCTTRASSPETRGIYGYGSHREGSPRIGARSTSSCETSPRGRGRGPCRWGEAQARADALKLVPEEGRFDSTAEVSVWPVTSSGVAVHKVTELDSSIRIRLLILN